MESNVYSPVRVSVTHLKNNQHDMASFAFLEREVERFAYDFSSKRKKYLRRETLLHTIYMTISLTKLEKSTTIVPRECLNKQIDEKYNRISKILSKYMYLDPDLDRLRKRLLLKEQKLKPINESVPRLLSPDRPPRY